MREHQVAKELPSGEHHVCVLFGEDVLELRGRAEQATALTGTVAALRTWAARSTW
jgi:hypothetical protein